MRALPVLAAFLVAANGLAGMVSAPSAPAKWTFLVYMDADDQLLEPWGIADFLEMAKVGSAPGVVNIVVQFDRGGIADPSYGGWTDTRRFYVTKDLTPDPGNNLASWTPREINMADPANLTDFVRWGVGQYPAEHYFLVLWDHGNGWQGVVTDEDPPGPSYPHQLSAFALRDALKNITASIGRRIDVIGTDACRLTLEIEYELADYGDYFVGSEKDDPLAGWPYDTWLGAVVANPGMSPPEVGAVLAEKYVESYVNKSSYSVAISVVNSGELRPLVASLDTFIGEISSEEPYFTRQIVESRQATERYEGAGGSCCGLEYDLYNFAENVIAAVPSRRVERVGLELKAAIEAAVVSERHWDNPSPVNSVHAAHAHGVSLYFPQTGAGPVYAALALSQDSQWASFLSAYANGARSDVEAAANAAAAPVDANGDGYTDTLALQYAPAINATMVVDVYRDGRYAFSRQYVTMAGRADAIRYLLYTGGSYEVTFYLFDAGKLRNLTSAAGLIVEQLITFRGRVTGENDAPLDGATVTLADLANNRTATVTTRDGGQYAIAVAYPTWFREGDPLELRVVAGDRQARLEFNATAQADAVVHNVNLNTAAIPLAWLAALAVLAALAAVGLTGTVYFWRRLRRFKRPPRGEDSFAHPSPPRS